MAIMATARRQHPTLRPLIFVLVVFGGP